MGCIISVKEFKMNPSIEGQDELAAEIFDILGLSKRDINLLYTAFWDMDADSSGLIRPLEMFAYFQVEGTVFEKAIFSLFDEDKSGSINFMEMVCTLWNILTLPEQNFGSVAYLLRDPSASENISLSDVRYILECIHNKTIDKDPALNAIFTKCKKELPNRFTIDQFNKWTAANPSVTAPLIMLQLHLRLQVIGEPFWKKLSDVRMADANQSRLDYVKQLQKKVTAKNNAFLAKLAAEERERRRMSRIGFGKGGIGQGRDVVARRQSVLLGFFSLKQPQPQTRMKPDTSNKILPLNAVPEGEEVKAVEKEDLSHQTAGGPQLIRRQRSFLKPNLAPENNRNSGKKSKKSNKSKPVPIVYAAPAPTSPMNSPALSSSSRKKQESSG